jgi:hypothetical protein
LRSKVLTAMLALAIAVPTFAADKKAAGNSQQVSGYLVDISCSTENMKKPDPKFPASHDKSCLQMDECAKSGYAVLTPDNKIIKFDAKGNEEAQKLLKMTNKDKDWKVTVSGPVQGDSIAVNSIMLQK